VEFFLHLVILGLVVALVMKIHNPNNSVYANFSIPIRQEDSSLSNVYPGGAQPLLLSNIINSTLLGMTFRVFAYECIAIFHSGNIRQWVSSVWNWIDIFSVVFYVLAVVSSDFGWASRMVAALSLMQFWKTLYFLEALRPFAALVQVIKKEGSQVFTDWLKIETTYHLSLSLKQ